MQFTVKSLLPYKGHSMPSTYAGKDPNTDFKKSQNIEYFGFLKNQGQRAREEILRICSLIHELWAMVVT
jgi:hypothetical protein